MSGEDVTVLAKGSDRMLAAKEWAAAKEGKADHRDANAEMLGPRNEQGASQKKRLHGSSGRRAGDRTRTTSLHVAAWGAWVGFVRLCQGCTGRPVNVRQLRVAVVEQH